MDDLTPSQYIETSKEYMKFCTYVIDKEMKRFNLDSTVYQSFVAELSTQDVNFDIAYNRCAFMYKYTLCNIYFIKVCVNKFFFECSEFKNLISKWTADSNVRLCSLSSGPGLDYLSFMLALSEHLCPPLFKGITVLSKYGAWRNTVGMVADALEEGILSKFGIGGMVNFKNIEVVQTNLLTTIPMKGFEALEMSSVILMVRTLNLTEPKSNEEVIKTKLLELISSLKPETAVFFIDTKPSLTLFLEVLPKCPGKFLYKPEHFSFRVPITLSDDYKEKHGCFPVLSSRGAFFVWQKLSVFDDDVNISIPPLNPADTIKVADEISWNSFEKANDENVEILNITKSLKDFIFPNNKNLEPITASNVVSDSHINDNMKESVSTTSSPVNLSKQLEIYKSTSIQALFSNQSVQENNSQVNFDNKSNSSHSLKKSISIDDCFSQGSSKSISFLGDSDLKQNYSWRMRNEETCPTSFPEHNAFKKKINEDNNAPKSNQAVKPALESKATQTEFQPSNANSSLVKDLTERVKRLVSSLESEVQKNIPDGQMNYHLDEIPNRSTNYASCSTNCSNNSDVDIKPCYCNQIEMGIPVSCCNHVKINGAHCCAVRHNPIHRCEMRCRSCIHRCHIHPCRPCENNIAATGTRSAPPQIIIPLQNISNDILFQIISAAKSGSNLQL